MIVKAIKDIFQAASGDSPALIFASKGQVLDVVEKMEDISKLSEWKKEYKYLCQDTKKRHGAFYVKADEVKEVEIN